MVNKSISKNGVSLRFEVVDCTQADLDRGLTSEEIARDRHDLNIKAFCSGLVMAVQEAEMQGSVMTDPYADVVGGAA